MTTHLDACRRPSGPTCSRCGRQHPPPPPPGPTPTIIEDRHGRRIGEGNHDGSTSPTGTAARLEDERRRLWCSSWSAR